jgi:hypothetical protein
MMNVREKKMTQHFEEVEANIVLDKGQPTGYYVQIEGKGAKATIQIFYTDINDKQVKRGRLFRVGDIAEWGSYNISYTGRILSITNNTVTISHHESNRVQGSTHRLKLHQFCWRNKTFDFEATQENNRVEMMNH